MSYAIASYVVVVGGALAYAAWLARLARRLGREVEARARTNRG